jgi:hypothetical protein
MSVKSLPDGKTRCVSEPSPLDDHEIVCPHCHKRFAGELIEGRAARYAGFKCPHCKLFVPLERVEDGRPAVGDATRLLPDREK